MEQTIEANENEESLPEDSLLACLMILCKFYKNPLSAAALTAGLPLTNNRLVMSLFPRAAERANLLSQIQKRALNKISKLALPVVLILENQSACILTAVQGNTLEVVMPEVGPEPVKTSLAEIAKSYLGYAIFVRPKHEASEREQKKTKPIKKHWFLQVFLSSVPVYSEIVLASILINIFALVIPLYIMNIYNRVIPNNALETLWVLTSGVLLVFCFDFVLKSMRGYFIDRSSKAMDIHLSSKIFSHILGVKMDHRPNSIGEFANSIQSFEYFRDFITSTTITVLVDIPFVCLFIFVIFLIGGNLGFIPLALIPIVLMIGLILQAPLLKLTKQSFGHNAEKQSVLYETLNGAETIKTLCVEGEMQKRWEHVIGLAAKLNTRLRFLTNFGFNFATLAQQFVTVSIVILGVYKIGNNELTTGGLVACILIGGRALTPITQIPLILTKYIQAKNAIKNIKAVMQLPTERSNNRKLLHVAKLKGEIAFDNVSFSYHPELPPVLKNVSFKIHAGEKVAFIGRFGSGKTTIAKLLLGLYQVSEGLILLDDIEINQLDPADIRRNIGYVPQEIILFNNSIRENIVLSSPEAEDAQIIKSLEISGLNRFIKSHPHGLDCEIGENGRNLSGGQRQAIAIARSLLNSPQFYLFDEPTNAMDDNSELHFITQFAHHANGKTTILITHKASMLKFVDRLIVLDKGKIVMDGPKDKVLANMQTKLKQGLGG